MDHLFEYPYRLSEDEYFMSIAIMNSHRSLRSKPNGCVVVLNDRVIAEGFTTDVHGETSVLDDCTIRKISLKDAVMYTTHYPCVTCFHRIVQSGIRRIYYYYDHKNDPTIHKTAENKKIEIIQLMHY